MKNFLTRVRLNCGISCVLLIVFFMMIGSPVMSQSEPDTAFNILIRTENGGWVAGDATYSIKLTDEKTLYLFGDSFIGDVNEDHSLAPGAKMIRNCGVLQDGVTMTAIYNGTKSNPDDFVSTDNPDSSWFWPEHGILIEDTLYIIMSKFITDPDAPPGWNFKYSVASLCTFTYPELELQQTVDLPYYALNEVMYGDRLFIEDDYIYIYGRKEENPSNNIPYAHVARVEKSNLHGDWEFWEGTEWTDQAEESMKIAKDPVSQQFSVFKHEDKYILLTQEIWLGKKIYTYTSENLTGPFQNKTIVYETPILYEGTFTYNAWAHPQFDANNELLVSYNSNGDFWEIFKNVEIYRPRFIRVPYEMIDSDFSPNSLNETKQEYYVLHQNYPNPVSDNTVIEYEISQPVFVSLKLMNINGQEMGSYVNKTQFPGSYKMSIEMANFKPGIYIYKLNEQSHMLIKN